jgi:hypothetical protein
VTVNYCLELKAQWYYKKCSCPAILFDLYRKQNLRTLVQRHEDLASCGMNFFKGFWSLKIQNFYKGSPKCIWSPVTLQINGMKGFQGTYGPRECF